MLLNRRFLPAVTALSTCGLFVASFMGGCLRPDDTILVANPGGGNVASSAAVGGSGPVSSSSASTGGSMITQYTPEQFFNLVVKPDMIENCGEVGCHASGNINFLEPDAEYVSIKTYKTLKILKGSSLVRKNWQQSVLLSWPDQPDHTGSSYEDAGNLKAKVTEWLEKEAITLPEPTVIEVGPFAVKNGLNRFPLDFIGFEYIDAEITFYATVQSDSLEIDDVRAYPANSFAMRVHNPAIGVYLAGQNTPQLDAVSLGGPPEVYHYPENTVMGETGNADLTWGAGAKLSFQFDQVDLLYTDDNGGTFDKCNQLQMFIDANVALASSTTQFTPYGNGLVGCATYCHGGPDQVATGKFDLSPLMGDVPDWEHGCAIARGSIVPGDVDASNIMSLVDPASPPQNGHLEYRFGGQTNTFIEYKVGLAGWIFAEAPQGGTGGQGGGGGAGGGM